MAAILQCDTFMDRRPDIYRRDSVLLCDRFWDAVQLDSGYFDDDMSVCCNDDYAFFGGGSLDAFDRICTMSRSMCGRGSEEDSSTTASTPSTPMNCNLMYFGNGVDTPVPSSPIECTMAFEAMDDEEDAFVNDLHRPMSPIQRHLTVKTPRPASPAVSLLTMASSFLDGLLQLSQAPPEMDDTRELLKREYDVSIVESEVMVQVVEGAKWAGLWNATHMSENEISDDIESPIAPMIDTPPNDFDLYTQRMADWRLQRQQKKDNLVLVPNGDLD